MASFIRRNDSFSVEDIVQSVKRELDLDVPASTILGLVERTIHSINTFIRGYRDVVYIPVDSGFTTKKDGKYFMVNLPSYINSVERVFTDGVPCDIVSRNRLGDPFLYKPCAPLGRHLWFNAGAVDTIKYTGDAVAFAISIPNGETSSVDWGDGIVEEIGSSVSQITHIYSDVGNYSISITSWDSLELNTQSNGEAHFNTEIQSLIKYGLPEAPDYNIYMPYLYKPIIEAGVFAGLLMRPQYDRRDEAKQWQSTFNVLIGEAVKFERNPEPNVAQLPTYSF